MSDVPHDIDQWVRDAFSEVREPSDVAVTAARAALQARIDRELGAATAPRVDHQRAPRRRFRIMLPASVVALGAAVLVAIAVAPSQHANVGPAAALASTVHQLASSARAGADMELAPGSFLYLATAQVGPNDTAPELLTERWIGADGSERAHVTVASSAGATKPDELDNHRFDPSGRGVSDSGQPIAPISSMRRHISVTYYGGLTARELAALSTDPATLKQQLVRIIHAQDAHDDVALTQLADASRAEPGVGTGPGALYERANQDPGHMDIELPAKILALLSTAPISADVRAACIELMGVQPGVRFLGNRTDAVGRRGTTLRWRTPSLVAPYYAERDLIFDRTTGALLSDTIRGESTTLYVGSGVVTADTARPEGIDLHGFAPAAPTTAH